MLRLLLIVFALARVVLVGLLGFVVAWTAALLGVPLGSWLAALATELTGAPTGLWDGPAWSLPLGLGIALALLELWARPLARLIERLGSPM